MCVIVCGPAPAAARLAAMQPQQQRRGYAVQVLLNVMFTLGLVPVLLCVPPFVGSQDMLCHLSIPICKSTASQ